MGAIYFFVKAYLFKVNKHQLVTKAIDAEAKSINTMFMLHYFITKTHAKCFRAICFYVNTHHFIIKAHAKCFRAIAFIANTYLLIVDTCVFATTDNVRYHIEPVEI